MEPRPSSQRRKLDSALPVPFTALVPKDLGLPIVYSKLSDMEPEGGLSSAQLSSKSKLPGSQLP